MLETEDFIALVDETLFGTIADCERIPFPVTNEIVCGCVCDDIGIVFRDVPRDEVVRIVRERLAILYPHYL